MEEAYEEDVLTLKIGLHSQEMCRDEDDTRVYCFNTQDKTCAILTLETFSVYNYQTNEIVHQIEFIQNKDNHVISMSYSRKYELYFVYKENGTITILTKYLKKCKVFTSKMYMGFNLIYLDDYDLFISRTVTSLRFYKLSLKNYSKSGVERNLDFTVIEGDIENWNELNYIEGAYFCKKQNKISQDILAVWSPTKVMILDFPSLKISHQFEDPVRHGEIRNITNIFFATNYGYLLVGYFNGIIKVYDLIEKDTNAISTLSAHHKPIIGFSHHPNPNWVVSVALDGLILIWNLDNFAKVLQFNIPYEAKIHSLISHDKLIYSHDGYYYVGGIFWREDVMLSLSTSAAVYSIGEAMFPKKKIKKAIGSGDDSDEIPEQPNESDEGTKRKRKKTLNEIVFILENNCCVVMREEEDKSYVGVGATNHSEFKLKDEYKPNYIYPPPKCSKVRCIEKCPYDEDSYYIISGEGALLHYSVEIPTPKLINYYRYDYFTDGEKQNSSRLTHAAFVRFSKENYKSPPTEDKSYERDLTRHVGILTAGTEDGHVLFMDLNNMKLLVSRFSLHKTDIIGIQGLKCGDESIIATLCAEQFLKFSRLSKNRVELLKVVKTQQEPISTMVSLKNRLFIGTKNGNLGIFKIVKGATKDEYDLYGHKQEKPFPDHAGEVDILTLLPSYKLVFSYSQEDNSLRIWDYSYNCLLKVLVSECFRLQGIECLTSEGDLVLCYDYHITAINILKYLREKNVLPAPKVSQKTSSTAQDGLKLPRPDSREKINIERFFAVGALKKKNALQAASPRKSPMSKSRRLAIASPNNNLDDFLIKNLKQDFHTRSKSLLQTNPDLDNLQLEEYKDGIETEDFDALSTKSFEKKYRIRTVSIRSNPKEANVSKELKDSPIPIPPKKKLNEGYKDIPIPREPYEAYQRIIYTKPALPRPKERSSSVNPREKFLSTTQNAQGTGGLSNLSQGLYKLDYEATERYKKPIPSLGKEYFTKQNIKNKFIKQHLETLLSRKPDLYKAKDIERKLLEQLHPKPQIKETDSKFKLK